MFWSSDTSHKKKRTLRNMPAWLIRMPWIVVGCSLLLAALVLMLDFQKSRKESEITSRIYLERGSSLIYAFEATLQTGMGFKWTDEELQAVLDKLGTSPDIYYMAVTDEQGHVLAASNPALVGSSLVSQDEMDMLQPLPQAQAHIREYVSGLGDSAHPVKVFQVYRQLSVSQYEQRLREHGHMMMGRMRAPRHGIASAQQHFVIFVGYDMTAMTMAQAKDAQQAFVHWVILTFLGVVGLLSVFLVKNYQRSRQLVQETTAFSFALIDTLPLGIIAVDEARRITTFNPEASRITGLAAQDMLNRNMAEILPQLWAVLAEHNLLDKQSERAEQEVRCVFGHQRRIPLALSAVSIVTEDGHHAGYTIMLRDLGEIRRLQAEVRRQDRLAALGNMAAGIAHEIRNPLGAIKGLARFFQEISPPESEEARVATIMTQEVQRLDNVVGDLLELARPDTLNLAPVSLPSLFDRARNMVQADLDAHNVHFELDLPSPCPDVLLDFDRMTQVLLNLFLNAAQAMPQGGKLLASAKFIAAQADAEISISVGQSETQLPLADTSLSGAGELMLEVADTGVGIAPEKIQEIFSPYFTTKAHGTGLGLSLVHKIIETHDGEMEVSSKVGEGTRFTIRIPLPLALPDQRTQRTHSNDTPV